MSDHKQYIARTYSACAGYKYPAASDAHQARRISRWHSDDYSDLPEDCRPTLIGDSLALWDFRTLGRYANELNRRRGRHAAARRWKADPTLAAVAAACEAAARILRTGGECAAESADWRLVDALKMLRGLPQGSHPGEAVPVGDPLEGKR